MFEREAREEMQFDQFRSLRIVPRETVERFIDGEYVVLARRRSDNAARMPACFSRISSISAVARFVSRRAVAALGTA